MFTYKRRTPHDYPTSIRIYGGLKTYLVAVSSPGFVGRHGENAELLYPLLEVKFQVSGSRLRSQVVLWELSLKFFIYVSKYHKEHIWQ